MYGNNNYKNVKRENKVISMGNFKVMLDYPIVGSQVYDALLHQLE